MYCMYIVCSRGSHKYIPLSPIAVDDGHSGVDIGVLLHLLDKLPVLPRDGVIVGAVGHGRPPKRLVREPVLVARLLRRRRVQHRRRGDAARGRRGQQAKRARQHSGGSERHHHGRGHRWVALRTHSNFANDIISFQSHTHSQMLNLSFA